MLAPAKKVLERLRKSFSREAERAYEHRDDESQSPEEVAFAEGEAHAFGVASDAVRKAQEEEEA